MKRRFPLSLVLVLSILALTLTVSRGQTGSIIVPKETENAFGNSYGGTFFHSEAKQVYAAAEFAAAPMDVLVITEIAFRAEETLRQPDATVSRIVILMNVFPGSMEEIVENRSGVAPPITRVYDAENVRLLGRTGLVEAFDLRFPLQKPFVYDRRLGQLVVTLSGGTFTGTPSGLDSVYVFDESGASYKRGVIISKEQMGEPSLSACVFVTEFTYLSFYSRIDRIQQIDGKLQVEFTVSGDPNQIQVEAARTPNGPYASLTDVELIGMGEDKYQIRLPLPSSTQFFRIALR